MTQKIGIIGATGKAGSAVTAEALRRGHQVTALVRDAEKARALGDVEVHVVDALRLTSDDIVGLDALVNAFGTAPEQAEQHIEVTRNLIEAARELGPNSPRLLFILGAGSLRTAEGGLFVEEIRWMPGAEHWISIPENQLKQLDYLRGVEDVDWVGVSPQSLFVEGAATEPVLGVDEIILAADGESHTTTGTMAVALLDEIEDQRHSRTRFTVSDR
ncbi:NAD(P)-dependent oxidoreductase [Corynebacterium guangdongense]|uniref:NADH-flavin reductase n=1 Tax=Corynebacterium guangdongense TaxID=1783348 RepID=A0ABU2A035_9CORY|nr:NAD(P)H-binding protein [Corynebacterium guangdongense]MDR7330547.1 putative NADH-flavin reductase [Corynebacterium guangdongense]WJZ19101.1 NmrA-like family protein [Corynebacterium guangdongense]